jgi:hypothetical protein
VEEDFDEIALGVERAQKSGFSLSLGLSVDDGGHAFAPHPLTKLVRIVAGVTDERFAASVFKQLGRCDHFVPLARRDRDVERPTLGVDDGVEFG